MQHISCGRVLMVGLPRPALDEVDAARLAALQPAGLILFRRNLDTPERLERLLGDVDALPAPLPLLAIDQEGGRVSRLEPWIGTTPTAVEMTTGGAGWAGRLGRRTGQALRGLGVNVDFAPVVDLSPPETPNGIGNRAFSDAVETAVEMAGAWLDGLQSAGVAGCLKHFPGLGPTRVDSHHELPFVDLGPRDLARHLEPFRRLGSRAACVMVGHGHYRHWEPTPLPATASRRIVHGVLREELGFAGLAVSDDLEMGAVAGRDPDGSFAVQAMTAGCDLLLYCSDLDRAARAAEALERAASADPAFAERLEQAAAAVQRLATAHPRAATDLATWSRSAEELQRDAGHDARG